MALTKKTYLELKQANATFFCSSKGLKNLHEFALLEKGCYICINKQWIFLDVTQHMTTKEEIEQCLVYWASGQRMEDFQILQNLTN
jgi:hypothetical protein